MILIARTTFTPVKNVAFVDCALHRLPDARRVSISLGPGPRDFALTRGGRTKYESEDAAVSIYLREQCVSWPPMMITLGAGGALLAVRSCGVRLSCRLYEN